MALIKTEWIYTILYIHTHIHLFLCPVTANDSSTGRRRRRQSSRRHTSRRSISSVVVVYIHTTKLSSALNPPLGSGGAFKQTTAGHCGIPTCAPLITSPLTNELLLNMIILRTGISQERTFNVFSASGLRKSKN